MVYYFEKKYNAKVNIGVVSNIVQKELVKNAIFAVIAANAVAVIFSFNWWFAAPLAILATGVTIGLLESFRARNKLSRNITFILTIVAMSALVLLTGFLLIQNIEI